MRKTYRITEIFAPKTHFFIIEKHYHKYIVYIRMWILYLDLIFCDNSY